MILELDGTAMLRLVNGEPVVVGDLVVRQGPETKLSGMPAKADKPHGGRSTSQVRNSRANAKAALTGRPRKTGRHYISARFDSACVRCKDSIAQGATILYDYDAKQAYCEACGAIVAPAITKPQETNA